MAPPRRAAPASPALADGPAPAGGFRAAWWLRNPHLQTLWPTLLRRVPQPSLHRERLELPDGDFLDVDWATGGDGPLVLLLHGLEGSRDSPYIRGMLNALALRGWRTGVMHFRGCSGEPNRHARTYHSGETGDLAMVLDLLRPRLQGAPIALVGYSLGGNVLLKWLGECGRGAPVAAAVAVSVPFRLEEAARRLERGFSRIYQAWLLRALRRSLARKFEHRTPLPIPRDHLSGWRNFREFDDRVTAPLHGFAGVDDYYARASSRPFLARIGIPTLVLHALDDPFMSPAVVPEGTEVSDWVRLELSERGGHVGFIDGTVPWRPGYWLERRVPEFLAGHLA